MSPDRKCCYIEPKHLWDLDAQVEVGVSSMVGGVTREALRLGITTELIHFRGNDRALKEHPDQIKSLHAAIHVLGGNPISRAIEIVRLTDMPLAQRLWKAMVATAMAPLSSTIRAVNDHRYPINLIVHPEPASAILDMGLQIDSRVTVFIENDDQPKRGKRDYLARVFETDPSMQPNNPATVQKLYELFLERGYKAAKVLDPHHLPGGNGNIDVLQQAIKAYKGQVDILHVDGSVDDILYQVNIVKPDLVILEEPRPPVPYMWVPTAHLEKVAETITALTGESITIGEPYTTAHARFFGEQMAHILGFPRAATVYLHNARNQ